MPRLDGTGPAGQGPGTGRGQGYCNNTPGQRRNQWGNQNYQNLQGMPAQDELTVRKLQKENLELKLDKINQRIEELEKN